MRIFQKKRFAACLALVLAAWLVTGAYPLAAADAATDDEKAPTTVRLEILLTAKAGGKPIKNASVYVKFKEKRRLRRDKKREWSLKTNPNGRAVLKSIPAGRVLIQIVAPGWRTYGKFYEFEGGKVSLEIELERPPKWF